MKSKTTKAGKEAYNKIMYKIFSVGDMTYFMKTNEIESYAHYIAYGPTTRTNVIETDLAGAAKLMAGVKDLLVPTQESFKQMREDLMGEAPQDVVDLFDEFIERFSFYADTTRKMQEIIRIREILKKRRGR